MSLSTLYTDKERPISKKNVNNVLIA